MNSIFLYQYQKNLHLTNQLEWKFHLQDQPQLDSKKDLDDS